MLNARCTAANKVSTIWLNGGEEIGERAGPNGHHLFTYPPITFTGEVIGGTNTAVISGLYDFSSAKEALNQAKHGVAFAAAEGFDWSTALVAEDLRKDYGEQRFVALGKIGRRVHVLVFTPRGKKVWLISLRKANAREVKRHDQG